MSHAHNKTVPTTADVLDFVAQLQDDQQRQDSEVLMSLMSKISGKPPVMWGSAIIGFGRYHYTYATGREGDMPIIAFSPRKGKLVLYVMNQAANYSEILGRLGRHETSKACLYITKLADVDLAVLEELIGAAYADGVKTS